MVGKVSRKKRHAFEDGTSFEGGWERGLFHGHGTLEWGKLLVRGVLTKLMTLTARIAIITRLERLSAKECQQMHQHLQITWQLWYKYIRVLIRQYFAGRYYLVSLRRMARW